MLPIDLTLVTPLAAKAPGNAPFSAPWPVECLLHTEPDMEHWVEFNRKYSEMWPVIITKKDPLPEAEKYDGMPGKLDMFKEGAGEGG